MCLLIAITKLNTVYPNNKLLFNFLFMINIIKRNLIL